MAFNEAQKFVAKWEGGLSNHPSDPGGLTNYGISLRFLRALGHDVDGDGDVDAADIQALTPAGAAELLKQEFWTCQDLDPFPRLTAIAHYDASVNCGRSRAVRLLQSACNAFPGPQIKEDGKLGPKTRARVAMLDDAALAAKCVGSRQDFYKRLVVSDPKFSAFIDGWMNRTADLSKYIREVADAPSVANVAAALPQPVAPGVSAYSMLPVGDGQEVVKEVGAGLPGAGAVTAQISRLIGKNPTTYGAVGLFAMLVGNVRMKLELWVFDQQYVFQDANIAAALVGLGVIAWGLLGKHGQGAK